MSACVLADEAEDRLLDLAAVAGDEVTAGGEDRRRQVRVAVHGGLHVPRRGSEGRYSVVPGVQEQDGRLELLDRIVLEVHRHVPVGDRGVDVRPCPAFGQREHAVDGPGIHAQDGTEEWREQPHDPVVVHDRRRPHAPGRRRGPGRPGRGRAQENESFDSLGVVQGEADGGGAAGRGSQDEDSFGPQTVEHLGEDGGLGGRRAVASHGAAGVAEARRRDDPAVLDQAPDAVERLVVSAVQPVNRQNRLAAGAGAEAGASSRGLRSTVDVGDLAVTEGHPSHRMGEQSRAGCGAGSAESEGPRRAVDDDPGAEEPRGGQCASHGRPPQASGGVCALVAFTPP